MEGTPQAGHERGRAMATRVLATAAELGISGGDAAVLAAAHRAAMAPRDVAFADDHDPRYLHPGRSALILMLDVGECDADVLAATMLVESADRTMRVASEVIRAGCIGGTDTDSVPARERWSRVASLRDAVPPSGDPDLAERLVTADAQVRRIALAERLDHLRHAHLWPDPAERRRVHAEAEAIYLPLAGRTHPDLERRLAWWCRMFGRRHLR